LLYIDQCEHQSHISLGSSLPGLHYLTIRVQENFCQNMFADI